MIDKGIEGNSRPKHERRWRKTGIHTRGNPIWKEVEVKIDPTNPANVPTHDQLPPQKPPEVVQEERKQAQVDDWHKRTDI